jgi:hypothetical protein
MGTGIESKALLVKISQQQQHLVSTTLEYVDNSANQAHIFDACGIVKV